ncbi:hypothetical protein QQ045_032497 [Rhodiola kirilowii]
MLVPYTYSLCACGASDCIEVCDIRAWLPNSKLDHKLWKLVLLLGESYLALGQAYKEDGLLYQALRDKNVPCKDVPVKIKVMAFDKHHVPSAHLFSSIYLFLAKAWMLVRDIFMEFHILKGKDNPKKTRKEPHQRIEDVVRSCEGS